MHDDMIFLHGDLTSDQVAQLKLRLDTENVYLVIGPKEYLFPGKVQAIIRISEVIDFDRNISLDLTLNKRCNEFARITEHLTNMGKTIDFYGFDILFFYMMTQFSILFVAPVGLMKSGLKMLETDIPLIAENITASGICFKYQITGEDTKEISNCSEFQSLYHVIGITASE